MLKEEHRQLLVAAAEKIGTELSPDSVEKFSRYGELLLEWNKVMNLTAVTDEREIVIKHYVDRLTILPYLDRLHCRTLADIGSGAGFPGIPVKILRPELDIVLLDSLGKRVNFLNEVISELCLMKIRAVHMRAEEGGRNPEFREKFDCASARAVAPMNILLEYCMPFVRNGGRFLAMKGAAEEEPYENALRELKGEVESEDRFTLPQSEFTRRIVCVKKNGFLSTRYPRSAGIPRKKPL